RRGRHVGRELPRLAALPVGHDLGRLVVELSRHVLLPQVRRLQDVRVGGDEMVVAGHALRPPPMPYKQTFVRFKGSESRGTPRLHAAPCIDSSPPSSSCWPRSPPCVRTSRRVIRGCRVPSACASKPV